jgi:threonine dehydrogenase-like Zn-dependent dehydrogenase
MPMLAIRLNSVTGELFPADRPIPEPGPQEVRIAVRYAGVCQSDLHFISGQLPARVLEEATLGHEVGGVIDAVGPDVTAWRIGDEVTVHPVGEDAEGRPSVMGSHWDGSWAEYMVAPVDRLVSLAGTPLDSGAIIPDAVATPWAAITDTARVRPGEAVGVWGLGGLGYHAVTLLRLVGASPIIALDPLEEARDRALRVGADAALDPTAPDTADRIRELTGGRGLNVAFDFHGHPATQRACAAAVGRYGRVVLIGLPTGDLDLGTSFDLIRLSKTVAGHYGSEMRHVEELVRLVRAGRLDLTRSITAVYPLSEAVAAVDALRRQEGNPIRILLRP